ncbi:hypothetical protein AaE_014017, partial [Aphanomyces astaci]
MAAYMKASKPRGRATKHSGRATIHVQGIAESNNFSRELVDFMASVRHGEHFLTTAHLVTWLKTYQPE